MSDREIITFDATQFARIDMLANAVINALWEINTQLKQSDSKRLDIIIDMLERQAEMPAQLGFVKEELSIVHGLISEAINNFNGKAEEFMATQEERLRGVKTKLDAIQTGVDKIQGQLAELKRNNPELDDEISAIEETAGAIHTDVNPVVEPPPVEPPV